MAAGASGRAAAGAGLEAGVDELARLGERDAVPAFRLAVVVDDVAGWRGRQSSTRHRTQVIYGPTMQDGVAYMNMHMYALAHRVPWPG